MGSETHYPQHQLITQTDPNTNDDDNNNKIYNDTNDKHKSLLFEARAKLLEKT